MSWIRMHRKVKKNFLWTEKRVFSKFEAWMNLLFDAAFEKQELMINDQVILLKRGQVLTSQKKLAERWKWSRCKVQTFLNKLEKCQMLGTESGTKFTIVTILNYDYYQRVEDHLGTNQAPSETKINHQTGTNQAHRRSLKNSKNSLKEIKQEIIFPNCFNRDDCKQAWNLWLEHKKSKKQEYKSTKSQEIKINQLASELGRSPTRFIRAIENSIGNNYSGIFESSAGQNKQNQNTSIFDDILKTNQPLEPVYEIIND